MTTIADGIIIVLSLVLSCALMAALVAFWPWR